jgi:two-component system sensor histidine kinase ChvG
LLHDTLGSQPPLGAEVPFNQRTELLGALNGKLSTTTRVAAHPARVYLFLALPVVVASRPAAVVYVTRSTYPVLVELRRIRTGLTRVLIVALSLSFGLTLLLAWTLTRPIERLARAAHQVAAGKMDVTIPVSGGGELTDLGEALQSMTRKLEARHNYITQFAADVAHEFKSPLTAIRGAAELLAEGAADDPAACTRFLANIGQDAERLARLVSRLLELSRIEASDEPFQLVDIEGLVRRVVERVEGPDANVEVAIQTTRTFVMGRPLELETALYNLLDNALRYGRSLEPVCVTLEQAGDAQDLCIRVRDQGPGIAPEHLDKVFQRFFTTDATGEGTGLGLAIVASVAASHYGAVTVQSTPGAGTEFALSLPLPAVNAKPMMRR